MEPLSHSRLAAYLVALAAVALATLIRLSLDAWLGDRLALAVYFGAVTASVWVGGLGPGALASVLGYAAARFLFMAPRGHFGLAGTLDVFTLAIYLLSCVVVIAFGETLRHARAAARRASDSLNLALAAANMNTFDVDLDGTTAQRSDNARRFYGLATGDDSRDAFLRAMDPQDRQRHLEALHEARTAGKDYSLRFRFLRPIDQRSMWVESHGRVITDTTGRARFVGTSLDVTERVLLEQQLAEHALTLARSSQRKSEFIATLAHELRNPLAPIKACIGLMKQPQTSRQARDSALEVLERQAQRIEALVEDLLDVSRIEQGKIVLDRTRTDLAGIIHAATEESMPHIGAKSQRLSVQVPAEPVLVNVDKGRMVQVVTNLLNNSSKFTAENGSIAVSGSRDGNEALISVKDSGIGIAPENLQAIFEVFFQSGGSGGVSNAGLGLGLSLCRSLVEMHGGSIEAKSEGLGRGSEFLVRLPLADAANVTRS